MVLLALKTTLVQLNCNISSKKQCPDISDHSQTSHTCLRAPKSPIDLKGLFTSFSNQYLHCSWGGCTSLTACWVCKWLTDVQITLDMLYVGSYFLLFCLFVFSPHILNQIQIYFYCLGEYCICKTVNKFSEHHNASEITCFTSIKPRLFWS